MIEEEAVSEEEEEDLEAAREGEDNPWEGEGNPWEREDNPGEREDNMISHETVEEGDNMDSLRGGKIVSKEDNLDTDTDLGRSDTDAKKDPVETQKEEKDDNNKIKVEKDNYKETKEEKDEMEESKESIESMEEHSGDRFAFLLIKSNISSILVRQTMPVVWFRVLENKYRGYKRKPCYQRNAFETLF